MSVWRETRDGILLSLRVTPKAATDRIGAVSADAEGKEFVRVSVRAVPDKGKANEAVIKLLAKHLGVSKSALSVVSGATDRTKTIAIEGDPQALAQLMTAHWGEN
ncbi:MAG: DUF167 family protein [Parvibaculum sp.]|nr:DUF167 family protein [Parvibaculum sp.]